MPRELERAVVLLVERIVRSTRGEMPSWLVRPGKAECGARWPLVCSIYYDLGAAYEASGDKKTALANYLEVYSSNIDFRDVANRIKALKS